MTSNIFADLGALILVPVVVAALTSAATGAVGRYSEAKARKRNRYADAVATLVAWIEYPYRVRRRTDDDPATLTSLSERAHDLQERMARDHAWIQAENTNVANAYKATIKTINEIVGPCIQDAWNHPPAATAAEMNIGAWGPAGQCAAAIAALEITIGKRFHVR